MSSKAKTASKAPAKKAPAAAPKKTAASSTVKKSTPAAAPASTKGGAYSHLFEKNPRNYGIGKSLPPTKNLSRVVLWPRYIRLQRHRAILKKRLKVPPALAQFSRTLEKNHASTLFRLLAHYRPLSVDEKKKRRWAIAKSEAAKEEKKEQGKPSYSVKFGLNNITHLIESKKAKLVVIAHDVDPIELVVWLPALCRKMNVPFVIVKGKARLGHLVHLRITSALAVTDIKKEDAAKFEQIISIARAQFNDDASARKKWGGQQMGIKHEHVMKAREKARLRDAAQKIK